MNNDYLKKLDELKQNIDAWIKEIRAEQERHRRQMERFNEKFESISKLHSTMLCEIAELKNKQTEEEDLWDFSNKETKCFTPIADPFKEVQRGE